MDNKRDLRIIAKTKRKEIDIKTVSQKFCTELRQKDYYINSQNIMLYYPLKNEIDLLELLNDDKNFYFPKVDGDKLLVCPYCQEFKCSDLKIMEPCSAPVDTNILDLVVVPALMLDLQNYRLGYGGGFYDRFLAKNPDITTVSLIPKELYTEKLPHDEFDIPVTHTIII